MIATELSACNDFGKRRNLSDWQYIMFTVYGPAGMVPLSVAPCMLWTGLICLFVFVSIPAGSEYYIFIFPIFAFEVAGTPMPSDLALSHFAFCRVFFSLFYSVCGVPRVRRACLHFVWLPFSCLRFCR